MKHTYWMIVKGDHLILARPATCAHSAWKMAEIYGYSRKPLEQDGWRAKEVTISVPRD